MTAAGMWAEVVFISALIIFLSGPALCLLGMLFFAISLWNFWRIIHGRD